MTTQDMQAQRFSEEVARARGYHNGGVAECSVAEQVGCAFDKAFKGIAGDVMTSRDAALRDLMDSVGEAMKPIAREIVDELIAEQQRQAQQRATFGERQVVGVV